MADDNCKAPALAAGLELIEALAGAPAPLGLSEAARLAGTNKNMAGRLLAVLCAHGWAESVEPGPRYRLTLKPFAVAGAAAVRLSPLELARGPLHDLWERTGESVYFAVPGRGTVVYLEHFDATGPVKVAGRAGGEYPLHCTAPGKAILAHLGPAAVAALIKNGLPRLTERTVVTAAALRAELERVRRHGYATDHEEFGRGILCVAAPVFDGAGRVAGAVGLSATTLNFTLDTLLAAHGAGVTACAGAVSAKLGFTGGASDPNGSRPA